MKKGHDWQWARDLWLLLHRWCLRADREPGNLILQEDLRHWLEDDGEFMQHILCDLCKQHTREHFGRVPPRSIVPGHFFAFSVDFHNQVNTRLQRPHLSIAEAAKIHRNSDYRAAAAAYNKPSEALRRLEASLPARTRAHLHHRSGSSRQVLRIG